MNLIELFEDLKSQAITTSKIAEAVNCTYQTINNYRKGLSKNPDPEILIKIATAFRYILKYENNKPHFYPIEDDDPTPPQGDYGTVAKKYAGSLGYDGTPEGLDMFLRECRGKYRTLHTIRKLLSNSEGDEQSKIDNQ